MALGPKDIPLWPDHGLKGLPEGHEVRRGMAVGREVVLFHRLEDGGWFCLTAKLFDPGLVPEYCKMVERPAAVA